MKKRPAKRIQKPQQITNKEKQLLDLMASLIVEISFAKGMIQYLTMKVKTAKLLKLLIVRIFGLNPPFKEG